MAASVPCSLAKTIGFVQPSFAGPGHEPGGRGTVALALWGAHWRGGFGQAISRQDVRPGHGRPTHRTPPWSPAWLGARLPWEGDRHYNQDGKQGEYILAICWLGGRSRALPLDTMSPNKGKKGQQMALPPRTKVELRRRRQRPPTPTLRRTSGDVCRTAVVRFP